MPVPPVLVLSRASIAELATSRDYLRAIREAFTDMSEGRFEMPSVGHVAGCNGAFHIKAARRAGSPALAVIKVNGNFPENAARYGLPTIQGFIALLDAERGSVLALMDSIEITGRRTAAATALAAQYLAAPDVQLLGVIGCGVQARYHVEALLDIAPIRSVLYCDVNDKAAHSFEVYVQTLGLQAKRVSRPAEACRGAGIIVTLTSSSRGIIELADVSPGAFVAGVGADNPSKHELAPDLLCGGRLVVDSLSQATTMGDLHHAIESGCMKAEDVYGELADLVAGKRMGRKDSVERWIFDSTGLALQDLAAAAMIYDRACIHRDEQRDAQYGAQPLHNLVRVQL